MVYVKRNVNNSWKSIEVPANIVKECREKALTQNIKVMDRIKREMPADEYTDGERSAVFATIARHYHYFVEDYVDSRLKSEALQKIQRQS